MRNRGSGLPSAVLAGAVVLAAGCGGGRAIGDGARDFLGAEAPPVRLHADHDLERFAAGLLDDSALWAPMPGLGAPASWLPDGFDLWVVRDLAELDSVGLGRAEDWVAGVAAPGAARMAVRVGRELPPVADLRAVLRHELAHLVLFRATGGRAPAWLDEGYAQLAAGAWGVDDAWGLQTALLRSGGGALARTDPSRAPDAASARTAYLLAFTATVELRSLAGDEGLAEVFRGLREGKDLDGALRSAFGLTEDAFAERWRRNVLGRYGWLYVITRAGIFWLFVSTLVIAVFLRRIRRDRTRLAAMKAGEREQGPEWTGEDVDWPDDRG